MENVLYSEITNSVTSFVAELGTNYKLVPLEGKKNDGSIVKILIVEVNGQNFLQIDSDNIIAPFMWFPKTKYQKAVYHCFPHKKEAYCLMKNKEVVLNHNELTCDEIIRIVFGDIKTKLSNITKVSELLSKYMPVECLSKNLGYDINEQTYFIVDWEEKGGIETLFFLNYFREKFQDIQNHAIASKPYMMGHIAKYTSLETAAMILQSGKVRMMSVTAMNDKKEIGHLFCEINKKENEYLENKTKIQYAQHRYITSFTNKIDDLTMWRLYGDNGNGVCLIFSEPYECQFYLPVEYSNLKYGLLTKVNAIYEGLLKHGYKFTFKSLKTIWQYFIKPEGFITEQELRYLRIDKTKPDGYTIASNGVLSGYKDLSLFSDNAQFPANLQGIILGPNMKNAEINKYQLETIAEENGIPLFMGIEYSTINYYI